ncbi:unnamed protein product [Echinostoma caproni]|uniref:DUF3263 domain-containing protein n=1 Tax=Echinostoma caproni TaxID=27848 RepID=A0A183B5V4_9TREM|nr:unnamed protein product [Echinostoma caproni]
MTGPDHQYPTDSETLWAHIKAPEFMLEDPGAFLTLLEARFHETRATGQLSRYHKLLSAIPRELLSSFRDIYMNTRPNNPYNLLKEELIRRMVIFEEDLI